MADAFIGEIRLFAFNYVPEGWLGCDGAVYPFMRYEALGAQLGASYGGDGRTTFAVPNLGASAMVGTGSAGGAARLRGKSYGEAAVTLTPAQMASHTHQLVRHGGGWTYAHKLRAPSAQAELGGMLESSNVAVPTLTSAGAPTTSLAPATLQPYGGGGAHENRQPFLALNICICYDGVWPPQP